MTQTLADKPIHWYEESIEMVKGMEDVREIRDIILHRNVDDGVCRCAMNRFYDDSLYGSLWVRSFGNAWWFQVPAEFDTKPEILQSLQLRVDRLKTFKE